MKRPMPAPKPTTHQSRSPLGSEERRIKVERITDGVRGGLGAHLPCGQASEGELEAQLTLVMARGTGGLGDLWWRRVRGRDAPGTAGGTPALLNTATNSPDFAALAFWADHWRVGFAAPCFLEFREIGEWADYAILGDGMGIALHHQTLEIGR